MYKPQAISVFSLLSENIVNCVIGIYQIHNKKIGYSVFLFVFYVCVAVQCGLSEWSPWGPCMKKNKTCGFKKGNQTRSREPLQLPSPNTSTGAAPPSGCVPETQTQRCTVQKKIPCKGKSEKEQHKHFGKWMDRKCLC